MTQSSRSTLGWLTLGAFCSALAFAPVSLTGNPSVISPLPIYALFLLFIAGPGVFVVSPILFTIQFLALHKRQNFLRIQAGFLAVLWALTPLYFLSSWDYGLRWMGVSHTYSVFILHFSGLLLLSVLAVTGLQKQLSRLNNTLNITMFAFVFWGAFPTLGELP